MQDAQARADVSPTFPQHHSCALCHARKVRCDKQNPCGYCVSRGRDCVPQSHSVRGPRKKRFPEAELLARLKRYEAALLEYGADLNQINSRRDDGAGKIEGSRARSSYSTTHPQPTASPSAVNDVRETEKLLQDSSEDEQSPPEGPIFATYDDVFATEGGGHLVLAMGGPGSSVDLLSLHPSPVLILQLWQVYLENAHPLQRVFHAPTIQRQLFKIVNDLSSITPAAHALLFSIYTAATMTMREPFCLELMGEDKYALTNRLGASTQVALHKAGFLRSSDATTQQAFVLHLIYLTKAMDPRSLLSLTAIAERNARRNGLHRRLHGQAASHYDSEMRTRLWWEIMALQNRAAETSTAGPSALSADWHTPLPLNVNESDIDPDMKAPLPGHQVPTDMFACLIRYEVVGFLRQIWAEVQMRSPDFGGSEFGDPSVALAGKLQAIADFESKLEAKYLRHCDQSVSLHVIAQYFAVFSLSKMRIAAYSAALQAGQVKGAAAAEQHREALMVVCLEAVEAYTASFNNKMLEKFLWILTSTVPFLAYVHLLFHLRHRPSGPLADRAWSAVTTYTDMYGRPRWVWGLSPNRYESQGSALQLALANLAIKAWEARVAALPDGLAVPALIEHLREKLATYRSRREERRETEARRGSPGISSPGFVIQSWSVAKAATQQLSLASTEPNIPVVFGADIFLPCIPMDGEPQDMDFWNSILSEDSRIGGFDWG